ncbi:MAG: sporadic carbohydrate cluster protein, LIC12192 family [Candidatus Endolissoclinum sp. TMED37]|nr:MAG: sporadic carbohydrate cluster protein, LIC12192 family [Candidatus Endolissoclinum sp. TMED37]|tara:strand:+ start:3847 stop:4236 length:390 start_codon:yes stop_codon:yes gene_type:complete
MKKVKGYNFSREFMGERAPQHIQNIVIKDFCKKKKLKLLLSASEYSMSNSYYILEDIISNLNNLDGIVAYSLFQMPENMSKRNKIFKKILKKKKIMCFAVEQIILSKVNQLEKINKIWEIKQTLPFCLK